MAAVIRIGPSSKCGRPIRKVAEDVAETLAGLGAALEAIPANGFATEQIHADSATVRVPAKAKYRSPLEVHLQCDRG